mmetsp:Transcript_13285/g.16778  ORF Transcript_13285/g.16778 Transcript_13285/m.16778 type:complete len:179 (-) Transcript_13285:401-937(-)
MFSEINQIAQPSLSTADTKNDVHEKNNSKEEVGSRKLDPVSKITDRFLEAEVQTPTTLSIEDKEVTDTPDPILQRKSIDTECNLFTGQKRKPKRKEKKRAKKDKKDRERDKQKRKSKNLEVDLLQNTPSSVSEPDSSTKAPLQLVSHIVTPVHEDKPYQESVSHDSDTCEEMEKFEAL